MAKKKSEPTKPKYQLFPANPRLITTDEFIALGESLGEFGSLDGIVINTSPGKYEGAVISGNQKAKHIGIDNLEPVILERREEPTISGTVAYGYIEFHGERFPYREVYWSERKCEIGNIRANNFGGHNDIEVLKNFDIEVLLAAGINIEFEEENRKLIDEFILGIHQEKPEKEDEGEGEKVESGFGVLVTCKGANEQSEVLQALIGQGLDAKTVAIT